MGFEKQDISSALFASDGNAERTLELLIEFNNQTRESKNEIYNCNRVKNRKIIIFYILILCLVNKKMSTIKNDSILEKIKLAKKNFKNKKSSLIAKKLQITRFFAEKSADALNRQESEFVSHKT